MNKRKVGSFALCAMLFAFCLPAEAQQPKKVPRIGYVGAGRNSNFETMRQGLQDLGYVEGKNIIIEDRNIQGKINQIPTVVAELVQLNVDILVLGSFGAIPAAKQATKTIPIVMLTNVDPVAEGIVDSLAHPGGNITGIHRRTYELSGKRLELLKEAVPKISRVGILWDPDQPGVAISFKEYEAAARVLKIGLQSLEVRSPNPDLEGAFEAATKGRASALVIVRTFISLNYSKQIVDLAIKNRLPSMCEGSDYVEAGGLMSYMTSDTEIFRRIAYYIDKILKGAKPADLPVEQPTKFELVINLKTAKQIGLTIPPNVLARADKVFK
jgi:putative tryptophan/tyrosine transport system substrate-binding protein